MPRVTINLTNFTAGEVSPRCYGRVDLARYQNGAKTMTNLISNIHGGAERRDGSVFVADTKFSSTRECRIIPFIFSTTQAYILELGHLYMRFYVQSGGQILSGGLPLEIVTPYTEDMLAELDYTQGADTMFLFHPEVPIQALKRFDGDSWVLGAAPFLVEPFDEIGFAPVFNATLSLATVGAGRTLTSPVSFWLTGDKGRRIIYAGGVAVVTGITTAFIAVVEIESAFPTTVLPANNWEILDSPQQNLTPSATGPVGATANFTTLFDAFRAEDVGMHLRINGGLARISAFIDPTHVEAVIKAEMTSVVTAQNGAWTLEPSVWNALKGYPRTGAFYEQRLCVAGSPAYPQTVWGSRSGGYYDFTIGVNDDDAFAFALPSTGQINPIQRMTSASALMPLTYGGEATMEGGNDEPITPTHVRAKTPSKHGSNSVKPVSISNETLFVQRAGRKIRSLAYRIESDSYNAPDLTVLAEHITESGITDMCYQQEPRSILWCVRADGKLATLTLDRDEGVIAWTRQETDGLFMSVASIPNATGDEVWCVVRRLVDNVVTRYVERFDSTRYTDCGIIGSNIGGASVWAGLDHLEAKDVAVKADGVYMGLFTVTGGEITIDRDAFEVEIGLPFTSTLSVLRPEIQAGDGTAQGNSSRVHETSVLLMETTGMKINGDEVAFREFGPDLLDMPPELFSGFKRAGLSGWVKGIDQPIVITQDEPYPFHVLGIVRKLTVNS